MQLTAAALFIISCLSMVHAAYRIGVGIADCTGPPAEVTFMGYAKLSQKGEGIHLRQFSRAFIIDDGTSRVVFVSADIGMMGHGLRRAILRRLQATYGGVYNEQNVILSGTHTHGGPGGYLMDVIFDITCLGFLQETFDAITDGICASIDRAHANLVDGQLFLASGRVEGANINRSPAAYDLNPEEEKAMYDGNVDKELTQLQFVTTEGKFIGVITWFAVHPTSMNNTNHLVTSDNMGYASILLEEYMNYGALPGRGEFVAAFASSNLGDVSPNVNGARCNGTGDPCDYDSSTCNGVSQQCFAFGPGRNGEIYESTKIVATRIFEAARHTYHSRSRRQVQGAIKSIHQFVDMPKEEIEIEDEYGQLQKVKGCLPAMGYSFAAGTTDGPGEFTFTQGTTTGNQFWNTVRDFLAPPTEEDIACQAPKPILLATGRMTLPYDWQPQILSSQVALIGDIVLAAIPGEFTTMSGRRMRRALKKVALEEGGILNATVIIAGLCNTYTDYITTFEEYQKQRYEAASTIYGPHTLSIHIHQFKKLLTALLKDEKLPPGPIPVDQSDKQISFITPVILDLKEKRHDFGECVVQPPQETHIGDVVTVEFVSGHPRNNLQHGKSYLWIERQTGRGWEVVATDASWETRFQWRRTYLASSRVTVRWEITDRYAPGVYRITHVGHHKSPLTGVTEYQGSCLPFAVYPSNSIS